MRDTDERSDGLAVLSHGLNGPEIPRILYPASPSGMNRVLVADEGRFSNP